MHKSRKDEMFPAVRSLNFKLLGDLSANKMTGSRLTVQNATRVSKFLEGFAYSHFSTIDTKSYSI